MHTVNIEIRECERGEKQSKIINHQDKHDQSEMRYRYFIDFQHGSSVFANFSDSIAVLVNPNFSLYLHCTCI